MVQELSNSLRGGQVVLLVGVNIEPHVYDDARLNWWDVVVYNLANSEDRVTGGVVTLDQIADTVKILVSRMVLNSLEGVKSDDNR